MPRSRSTLMIDSEITLTCMTVTLKNYKIIKNIKVKILSTIAIKNASDFNPLDNLLLELL